MCADLLDRPWAPFVLDGMRGAPEAPQQEPVRTLRWHQVLTARDGRLTARLDDQRLTIAPGQVLLAQPGQRLGWSVPARVQLETLTFDCCWRARRRAEGARYQPMGQERGESLSDAWSGAEIPSLLTGALGAEAAEAIRAIGDLWWRDLSDRLLAHARLAAWLAHLHQQVQGDGPTVPAGAFAELCTWAARRLEHGVRVEDLADEAGLERSAFTRAFTDAVGCTPGVWLREQRLERARRLLRDGELSHAQIALHCGYRSRAAFEEAFLAKTGLRPGLWRLAERRTWRSRSPAIEPPAGRRAEMRVRPK